MFAFYVRQNGQVNKNDIGLHRVTRKKPSNIAFLKLWFWQDGGGGGGVRFEGQWGGGGVC